MVSEPYYSTHLGCRMVEKLDSDCSTIMLQILIGRSSQQLCRPQYTALDVGSGLEAAQLMRTTSRGLARSRMGAPAPFLRRPKFVSEMVRKRVKVCIYISLGHLLPQPWAPWPYQFVCDQAWSQKCLLQDRRALHVLIHSNGRFTWAVQAAPAGPHFTSWLPAFSGPISLPRVFTTPGVHCRPYGG